MTKMDVTKLWILLYTGASLIIRTQSCSLSLFACEAVFLQALNTTKNDLEAGVVPEMSEPRLRTVCAAYDVYSPCVDEFITDCSASLQRTFKGIDNNYDYICGDGFQDHVRYAGCLGSEVVETETRACVTRMSQQLLNNFRRVCSILNEALACIARATLSQCGSAAANHRLKLEVLGSQPVADDMQCEITQFEFTTEEPTTTAISASSGLGSWNSKQKDDSDDGGLSQNAIIGIGVGIAVLLLLAIVCVVVCVLKQKRTEPSNQPPMGVDNPMYPNVLVVREGNVYDELDLRHAELPPAYDNKLYDVPAQMTQPQKN